MLDIFYQPQTCFYTWNKTENKDSLCETWLLQTQLQVPAQRSLLKGKHWSWRNKMAIELLCTMKIPG